MAIRLEKGQKINLEKSGGSKLTSFCVGCNWGAIISYSSKLFGLMKDKNVQDIDLDLSCIMVNEKGDLVDHIYSPLYRAESLAKVGMPPGKLDSNDRALHHSGDDLKGDQDGDDGLDNEIISVDLTKVNSDIHQIFFFLNNCGKEDFSQIPYASIRMYEGTPTLVKNVFAEYNVAAQSQYKGMTGIIMGKLYRRNNEWKFAAIGDAFPDPSFNFTLIRILEDYVR